MKKVLILPSFLNHHVVPYFTISRGTMEFLIANNCTPIIAPMDLRQNMLEQVVKLNLELLQDSDGVLLQGGEDISPEIYGKTNSKNIDYQSNRDKLEKLIIHKALEQNKPILGICRGMQMLNVALGGSLKSLDENIFKHLGVSRRIETYEEFSIHTASKENWHKVVLEDESILASYGLPRVFEVNSLHHQSVDKLGESLKIEARSDDGEIEIIGLDGKIIGCQFHPELSLERDEYTQIFNLWTSWL